MFEILMNQVDRVLDPRVLLYTSFLDYPNDPTKIYNEATDTIIDVSAAPIPKTLVNAKLSYIPVAKFDGTRRFQTTLKEAIGASDFTIENWARVDAVDRTSTDIFIANVSNTTSGQVGIAVGMTAGKIYTVTTTGSTRLSTAEIPADSWFHVCCQRTSGVIRIFLNGVFDSSYTHTVNIASTAFSVGAYNPGGTSRFFKGLMSMPCISKYSKYPIEGFTPPYPVI